MDKPIIFSTPMVQAIIDGKKTVTRRVVKNQFLPDAPDSFKPYDLAEGGYGFENEDDIWKSPYGQPGDFLWVRETWQSVLYGYQPEIIYRADNRNWGVLGGALNKWKPSIHMPKKYARIWLEVKAIKVERLQNISESGAEKEGIDFLRHYPDTDETLCAQELFMCLWDSINEKRGFGWNKNPWVWVIEFEKSEKPYK